MVTQIAADMKRGFPNERGWSRSNLLNMRRAAAIWPVDADFVQHAVGRLLNDARAALPSATEIQAVITNEIARIDS